MRITLKRNTGISDLEESVNLELQMLEAAGNDIVDIKYTACILPDIRGDKVITYRSMYSAMIMYCPRHRGAQA